MVKILLISGVNIDGATGPRDAGSQSEGGLLRESLYNDVIINAA